MRNRFPLTCLSLLLFLLNLPKDSNAQRTYHANSVLSAGSWFKISVKDPGVYKVDVTMLNSLGINVSNLPSSSIRLFGNGGGMLSEANSTFRIDDLEENSIQIVDGGDGIFNNSDYFLFYANGPDSWLKDSLNNSFTHVKNLYSDRSYYFISIGGPGKRIQTVNSTSTPASTISTFQFRYFHELDSVNFLRSGKEWYGEEFSNTPGHSTSRNFQVDIPNLVAGTGNIISNVVSRSAGAFSRFDVRVNNAPVIQHNVAFTGTGVYDPFAVPHIANSAYTTSTSPLQVNYSYTPGSVNAQGWLNWFELTAKATISMNGVSQLLFRNWTGIGSGALEFVVASANTSTQVWDITDALNPAKMPGNLSGTDLRFVNDAGRLREYVAFNSIFLQPVAMGKVDNQNLHNSFPADLIIITDPAFLPQAQQISDHHNHHDNLRSVFLSTTQVYNEFSSGSPDPTAIRDVVKMYFDKAPPSSRPKYLLLLGDASFDYKNRLNNNTSLVPAYESPNSLEPLSTYTSDDFFGFLNDNEDINNPAVINLLDIGIGRIPAKTSMEADAVVDKIIAYQNKESFGPWRNEITLAADDEDNNIHLQDAELFSTVLSSQLPELNQEKLYLDAYRQESSGGGSRYPLVNNAINNRILSGNLLFNYNGHGGSNSLAAEDILDLEMINSWNNPNKLPIFITATCDFAPFDDPASTSLGENLLLRPKTGGIALMTTTRAVFASSNTIINNAYLQYATVRTGSGFPALGQGLMQAKNYIYQNFNEIINTRKFTLLGDPALVPAFPVNKVRTTSINGNNISSTPDTLKALGKYTISGEVTDPSGNFIPNYNGTAYTTVFDKSQLVSTLANDPGSQVTTFQSQRSALFRGKTEVKNGRFAITFIVPKDINHQPGPGRLSYYTHDDASDGNGLFTNIIIGGIAQNAVIDNTGPVIKAWLNDEKFVNGGITNQHPVLIVRLFDSSGINTTGVGIGHDIVAILDDNNRTLFELNDLYEAELGSYQKGKISFQLPILEPGLHSLKIKAWDVFNNSSEYLLEFTVANDEELTLDHVLNYPNPFTSRTNFWFEHNHPGEPLQVIIRIYSIGGRLVKTIKTTIITPGNRSSEIEWDGKDSFGDKVARGVYFYNLSVFLNGKSSTRQQKIVRL